MNRYAYVRDGAYIREGLALTTPHIRTELYGKIIESSERKFNEMGLARLRIPSGWISEMLNPLSGQSGKIAEMIPMLAPLRYRVVIDEGCIVRRGVELSSPVVCTIPCGETVDVIEKRWSDHPSVCCVPRLRLLDKSGWISLRTVKAELGILDDAVVEYIGITPLDEFEAAAAGGGGGGSITAEAVEKTRRLLDNEDKACPESVKVAQAVSEHVESGKPPQELDETDSEKLLCIVCMVSLQ